MPKTGESHRPLASLYPRALWGLHREKKFPKSNLPGEVLSAREGTPVRMGESVAEMPRQVRLRRDAITRPVDYPLADPVRLATENRHRIGSAVKLEDLGCVDQQTLPPRRRLNMGN